MAYFINMRNKCYISGVVALDITLLFNTVWSIIQLLRLSCKACAYIYRYGIRAE